MRFRPSGSDAGHPQSVKFLWDITYLCWNLTFYGRAGKRWVSYDNERPKGDHRHVGNREQSYVFTDVETLIRDFLADVERWRSK
jgi:hypothetical protein